MEAIRLRWHHAWLAFIRVHTHVHTYTPHAKLSECVCVVRVYMLAYIVQPRDFTRAHVSGGWIALLLDTCSVDSYRQSLAK